MYNFNVTESLWYRITVTLEFLWLLFWFGIPESQQNVHVHLFIQLLQCCTWTVVNGMGERIM